MRFSESLHPYDGKHWVSTVDYNVWQPGVTDGKKKALNFQKEWRNRLMAKPHNGWEEV